MTPSKVENTKSVQNTRSKKPIKPTTKGWIDLLPNMYDPILTLDKPPQTLIQTIPIVKKPLGMKEHYKQVLTQMLSEASEKRVQRIERSIDSATHQLMRDAGHEPDASGSYDPMDVVDAQETLDDHPASQKLDKLQDVYASALGKKMKRETQIADQLKERNPDLYRRYYQEKKPEIFAQHTDMINGAHKRLQTLRSLNAPQEIIKSEQDRLDSMSARMHGLVHSAVAHAHKQAMELLYRPQ